MWYGSREASETEQLLRRLLALAPAVGARRLTAGLPTDTHMDAADPADAAYLAAQLAERLPLLRDPAAHVWEAIEFGPTGNRFRWGLRVFNAMGAGETVACLTDPAAMRGFIAARGRSTLRNTPWDAAARLRLVRNLGGARSAFDELRLIEAGANHLVLWLESQRETEITTSCGGRPDGFYVNFRGPDRTAALLSSVPQLAVRERPGLGFDGLGEWTVRLSEEPADFDSRDEILREVALRLETITGLSLTDSPRGNRLAA